MPSSDADTIVFPSGENATKKTVAPCPCRVAMLRADSTSHSRIFPLDVPAISVLLSGENATGEAELSSP